jgi:hypothetical protein
MKTALAVSLLCASLVTVLMAKEDVQKPSATEWDRLKEAATTYIAAHSGQKDSDAWTNKFKSRVESRMESSKLGQDEAVQSLVFDWMSDNEKFLREKQSKAMLEACRIMVWLHEHKLELPGLIRNELQKENKMAKLSEYLVAQATLVADAKRKVN